MKISMLVREVRLEVEKPFTEKLRRAKELIKIFNGMCPDKCVVACSFGKDSMSVLHLAVQENPEISVLFQNTGVQYGETYEFRDQITKLWNLNLIQTKPAKSFWTVAKKCGLPNGTKKDSDMCCYYLKEVPFKRLVKKLGWKVVFTGMTALESRLRMFVTCQRGQLYYNNKEGITKINPIIYWTNEEVLAYLKKHDIPMHPAYEKYGVERTGCVPCTAHKTWKAQMSKVNPKMYRFIQEKFFNQRLLEGFNGEENT